jgi:hypothetical protein
VMAGMNAPPEMTWVGWNNRLQEDSDRPGGSLVTRPAGLNSTFPNLIFLT